MMNFVLAGTIVGAVLGATNFSVLALIPAVICVLAIAGATSLLGEGATIAGLLSLLVSLQAAYIGAAGFRFALQLTTRARSVVLPPVGR